MRKIILFAGLMLASLAALAQVQFIEGQHYKLVVPEQPTADDGKIEVVEMFSYACPHCATFQPTVMAWHDGLSDNVKFDRIPVVFNPSWEPYARAYYAAESLGILEASHQAMFDKLHRERKRFRSMDDIAEFYTDFGVSKDDFLKAAKSFAVDTKLRRGMVMSRRYGVEGTPSLVIDGKYRTSVVMAGSPDAAITLTNQLVAQEAQAKAAEAAGADEESQATPAPAGAE